MSSGSLPSGRLVVRISTLFYVAAMLMSILLFFGSADSLGTLELGVALALSLVCFKQCRMTKAIPTILLTGFVLVMLLVSGKIGVTGFNAPIKHALKFVHLLFAFVCFLLFRYAMGIKENRVFINTVLIAAAISCLRSIYIVFTGNDYAIRYASRYGYTGDVAGFSQIYGIPFLIVIVCSLLFNGKKKKVIQNIYLIGLLAIYLVFIYVSLMATALILSAIGIAMFILIKLFRNNAKNALVIYLLALLFIMVAVFAFSDQVMNVVIRATDNMNYVVQNRIRYAFQTILNSSSVTSYTYERRDELSSYSINTFKEHPLFGVGYSGYGYGVIGCHQEWPDLLGVFGFIGTMIVAIVILYMINTVYKELKARDDKDLFLILTAMFIILGFLNPCLGGPLLVSLFVIAPNARAIFQSREEFPV